jgi:hypothetical protein
MSVSSEICIPCEFDLEKYLTQMETPETVTPGSPDPERRNPLNESFEDRCEITEAVRKFLQLLHPRELLKIQRFIFNNFVQHRLTLMRKVLPKQSRLPVCLSLLYRLSHSPGKILLVYRQETKCRGYLNRLRELSPNLKTQSYLGTLGSMILNDKRALQKPFTLLAFPLPRLINLISHKSIDLQSISCILFVDADSVVATQSQDLNQFVDLFRAHNRNTALGFIAHTQFDQTAAALSDSFSSLIQFENRTP